MQERIGQMYPGGHISPKWAKCGDLTPFSTSRPRRRWQQLKPVYPTKVHQSKKRGSTWLSLQPKGGTWVLLIQAHMKSQSSLWQQNPTTRAFTLPNQLRVSIAKPSQVVVGQVAVNIGSLLTCAQSEGKSSIQGRARAPTQTFSDATGGSGAAPGSMRRAVHPLGIPCPAPSPGTPQQPGWNTNQRPSSHITTRHRPFSTLLCLCTFTSVVARIGYSMPLVVSPRPQPTQETPSRYNLWLLCSFKTIFQSLPHCCKKQLCTTTGVISGCTSIRSLSARRSNFDMLILP